MFTCKKDNQFAVYMLTNRKTGDSYIGASRYVARRLRGHEISIRKRTATSPTARRLLEAFPDVADVEFRIIEFIAHWQDPECPGEEQSHLIAPECRRNLHDREHHWIRTLKPTLNKQIRRAKVAVESLPYGEPSRPVRVKQPASAGK